MSWQSYDEIIAAVRSRPRRTVAVAGANAPDVLAAVRAALDLRMIDAILVGAGEAVRTAADTVGLELDRVELHEAANPREAAQAAARLAAAGRAHVLLKGMVPSADFLGAILQADNGLRRLPLLSHLACFEVPALGRLVWITDGGVVPCPGLEQKFQILKNAIDALHALGWERPRVAVVAAVETVNPKMPATVDAAALAKAAERGQFGCADVDGPLALDGALDAGAARHKALGGPVAGRADLLLVPDIESGNLLGKAFVYAGGGTMAGLVLGAAVPAVMTSRFDPPKSRLASLAMAALMQPE